ncbi:hypothetical protein LCGC14_2851850, partial [marine sediment metagenome]
MALKTGLATDNPMCFAEDRKGNLFFATGLERGQRWAPGDTATEDVGLTAPTSGITPSAGGSGSIQGVYKVALRYVDDEGNPSNLSEITTLVATASAYTTISYASVTVPSEGRVDHKQIWRTTDGQEVTYYLDVDDLANGATASSSNRTDTELRAQVAMRYVTAKGFPNAMRFLPPPTHTGVMVAFKNRMWYAVPSAYDGGSSVTVSGTTAVS